MSARPPLPAGFRLRLDRHTRVDARGATVNGGVPWRQLRLSPDGLAIVQRLAAGEPVATASEAVLARRLVDGGLAHPIPPAASSSLSRTVVVPARDRLELLGRCLTALAGESVLVVDDGSSDETAMRATAERHGAALQRHPVAHGPAAARNRGVAATDGDLVAFVDSDCLVTTHDLDALCAHFADPAVVAVAPRVLPEVGPGRVGRYGAARSPLDLGTEPAPVRPSGAVRYVPATALVVRRSAAWRTRFDEQLRHGEDVDFIWRLVDAGGDVRYEPSVTVRHVEPTSVSALAARRFRYGASVGPLAMRHGTRLSGPSLVGLLAPVKVVQHARRGALGWPTALDLAARSLVASGAAYGKWAGSTWAPLSPLAVVGAGASWLARRPEVDPLTWTAASVVDDAAYAAGVWFGSARARVAAPLRPRLAASR